MTGALKFVAKGCLLSHLEGGLLSHFPGPIAPKWRLSPVVELPDAIKFGLSKWAALVLARHSSRNFFACFLVHRQHEKSLNQPRAEEGLGGHSTSWRGHATSQAAKAEAQTKLKPFRIWIGIWIDNPNPVGLGSFHQNF